MSWSADFLAQRVRAALLLYLAVAHFGRGRGDPVRLSARGAGSAGGTLPAVAELGGVGRRAGQRPGTGCRLRYQTRLKAACSSTCITDQSTGSTAARIAARRSARSGMTRAPVSDDRQSRAWVRAIGAGCRNRCPYVTRPAATMRALAKTRPAPGLELIERPVPAPGPGAAAYSASKAALTQLARVAALEWGADRIRVNTLHPDAVFDTGAWTAEVLAARARHYGISVEDYKKRNVLGTEVTSRDVAELAAEMCGPLFAKTTGAQVPVDGGNDRVI